MVKGLPDWATFVKTDPSEMIRKYTEVIEQEVAVGDTRIIYTVPAGKILYLDACWLNGGNLGTIMLYGQVFVRDGADVFAYVLLEVWLPAAGAAMVTFPIPVCISIPPGYDVCVRSSHSDAICMGFIHGWEE